MEMVKIFYLLFAVLASILNANCRRPPPKNEIEEWGSIANFSRESVEPYDPYIPRSKEFHIPAGNFSVLDQYISRYEAKHPTTPRDPHDEPHLRIFAMYNNSPKPVTIYRIRHSVDDGKKPKPAFVNSLYDIVIQPYKWTRNESFMDDLLASYGTDEFGVILGYEGRNLTSKKEVTHPIPRLLPHELEYIQGIVDMPKNLFRVKSHDGTIASVQLVDYFESVYDSKNYEYGEFAPL